MNNLVHIFFQTAAKYGANTAIKFKDEEITYGELQQKVINGAAYLSRKGIKKGDRVLVFVPMSILLYKTVLALFSLGAVVVFVDEWADRERLRKAMKVVEVDAIIAPRRFLWLAYLLSPFKIIKKKIAVPTRLRTAAKSEIANVDLADTALITFTTGSTGLPKAADRTHRFLREQFRILSSEIGATKEDVCLVTLPIVLLSILGTGASGLIVDFNQKKPDQLDGAEQLKIISEQDVSMIVASPFYIDKLASSKTQAHNNSVRKIMTGGAPVFPDLAMKTVGAFPSAECLVAYGSTEAEPISVVNMEDVIVTKEGLSVGRVNEDVELKIIKITDQAVLLGTEGWAEWEVPFGEIVVAGPHVLTQYQNSEEAFRMNKILDGDKIWHRTGDSGCMVDGNLYLNGRCSQLTRTTEGYESLFIREYQLSQLSGVEIGTIVDGMIAIELNATDIATDELKVRKEIRRLGISHEEVVLLPSIPRDPRHHSKIDYEKLRASLLRIM